MVAVREPPELSPTWKDCGGAEILRYL